MNAKEGRDIITAQQMSAALATLKSDVMDPVARDFQFRTLSPFERHRTDEMLLLARDQVRLRLESGEQPRSGADTSRLRELLEGGLLAAKQAYEEKKIPLLANLLAYSFFGDQHLSDLFEAMRMAEQLSYRQCLVLAIIGSNETRGRWDNPLGLSTDGTTALVIGAQESFTGVRQDLFTMWHQGLLSQLLMHGRRSGVVRRLTDIIPADLVVSHLGGTIHRGARLSELDPEETRHVLLLLKVPSGPKSSS